MVMSSRALLIGCFAVVAAAMLVLTGTTIWSQHINQAYAMRADMAYRQALLVTQIEAAALAPGALEDAGRRALVRQAETYLATIADEERLPGGSESERDIAHQAQERGEAQRLVQAIAGQTGQGDIAQVRQLARAIAAREIDEVARARADAEAVASHTRTLVIAAAAGLLLLPLALLAVLQRQLAVPLRRLGDAAQDLAAARTGERLAPAGLAEIRALTAHFNAMADSVEARVAERTEELHWANADLAAVDQRRRLFLAKVSHELRTPVTAIRGEAEVALRYGKGEADLREALAQVEQSSLFLQRRLDDLLVLARAEDARLPMAEGVVDPMAIARQAGAVAASYARACGVRINLALPHREPAGGVLVQGDADRLQQALAAVIDNAIKFSPPGGIVTVAAEITPDAAVLTVTDQGPGIPEAELAGIFDPYVQGQGGRALGGMGLGLSLARWIVEAYRGTITARRGRDDGSGDDARGDEGLCVMLHLPIAG